MMRHCSENESVTMMAVNTFMIITVSIPTGQVYTALTKLKLTGLMRMMTLHGIL